MLHRRRVRVTAIHPAKLSLAMLSNKDSMLGVSLANPAFTGPSLPRLLDWAARHFGTIYILFGDYLERHNVPSPHPEAAAAVAMERASVCRSYINACASAFPNGKFIIESAYDLMRHSDFKKAHAQLVQCFDVNQEFHQIVMADVRDFLERKGQISGITYEEAAHRSISYILEELALFSQLTDRGLRVQIYPGRHLRVFTELASQRLVTPLTSLNNLICIDLKVGH